MRLLGGFLTLLLVFSLGVLSAASPTNDYDGTYTIGAPHVDQTYGGYLPMPSDIQHYQPCDPSWEPGCVVSDNCDPNDYWCSSGSSPDDSNMIKPKDLPPSPDPKFCFWWYIVHDEPPVYVCFY